MSVALEDGGVGRLARGDRALVAGCLVVATAGLWLHGGLAGAIAGLGLLALAAVGVDVPYVFAAAQVVVAAVEPAGLPLALAEGGTLAVLLVPATERERLATTGTTALVLGGGLALWTVASVAVDAVWALALVVGVGFATVAYALHRVEQLRLGKLDAAGGELE